MKRYYVSVTETLNKVICVELLIIFNLYCFAAVIVRIENDNGETYQHIG